MQTHDVSGAAKTGEALLKLVIEDIKWSEETYKLSVIGVCSDDGGDAKKMRRLLLLLMPWLIVILCWAHQINLIVGDFLALKARFLGCVPKAQKVVKWMNSHSRPLGMFRTEQFQTYAKILALIRPVITRWTAHYLSLRRLLDVEKPLRACWLKYGDEFIRCAGPKREEKEKAERIQAIIMDPIFWAEVRL